MPLVNFICPDNKEIEVLRCLYQGCRMTQRCQPIPYLHGTAAEREWTGVGSTTQLLNGTMYNFLKITKPYSVDPDSMAFAIQGTEIHSQLETIAKKLNIPSEISATEDGRNAVDLLQYEHGKLSLIDIKTWGSFRVAKAMGIVEIGKKPDPSGDVYKKSGTWGKAGSPKMVSCYEAVPSEADNWEAEMQLNRYRVMLEDKGIPIHDMWIHIRVRDGGLMTAKQRGITRNTYLIPIQRINDVDIRGYFNIKQAELQEAIKAGKWDKPCNAKECWDNVRCESYCPVAKYCPKGILELGNGGK